MLWKKLSGISIPDLENDPYMFAKDMLSGPARDVEKYGLGELKPLIGWLEDNMKPSEEVVLVHGDYHHSNVIVRPDHSMVVIDWSNIGLSDFRIDLGFTTTMEILMSGGGSVQGVVDVYEQISGRKVKEIEYFMILSNLYNIMRMYSAAVNYEITGISLDTLIEAIK
ncbi:MAG: aminoglycoside phosphotransferase (APT) family kinase protein [Candidatus Latescibacterota bacterium]|jgi:aminoglycoside phosphotransferase (APT) family kinase protein